MSESVSISMPNPETFKDVAKKNPASEEVTELPDKKIYPSLKVFKMEPTEGFLPEEATSLEEEATH